MPPLARNVPGTGAVLVRIDAEFHTASIVLIDSGGGKLGKCGGGTVGVAECLGDRCVAGTLQGGNGELGGDELKDAPEGNQSSCAGADGIKFSFSGAESDLSLLTARPDHWHSCVSNNEASPGQG